MCYLYQIVVITVQLCMLNVLDRQDSSLRTTMAPSTSTNTELNPQYTPPTQLNCIPIHIQLSCVLPPPLITNIPIPYEKEQSLRVFLDQECHTEIALNGVIKFPARLNKCALFPTNILKYVRKLITKIKFKSKAFT